MPSLKTMARATPGASRRRGVAGLLKKIARRLRLLPAPTPHQRLAVLLEHPERRAPEVWRSWRKTKLTRVQELLANKKGVVAARELSRALLQDPDFPMFEELMAEATSLKLRRDAKAGQPDPIVEFPEELRAQALQLEGFQLYIAEVEQLLQQAGFPSGPQVGGGSKGSRSRPATLNATQP